jgi:hypothetical protein
VLYKYSTLLGHLEKDGRHDASGGKLEFAGCTEFKTAGWLSFPRHTARIVNEKGRQRAAGLGMMVEKRRIELPTSALRIRPRRVVLDVLIR